MASRRKPKRKPQRQYQPRQAQPHPLKQKKADTQAQEDQQAMEERKTDWGEK